MALGVELGRGSTTEGMSGPHPFSMSDFLIKPQGGSAPSRKDPASMASNIDRTPNYRYSSTTIVLNALGTAIAQNFPSTARLATKQFDQNLGIVQVTLSTSILSTSGIVSLALFLDQGLEPIISLDGVGGMLIAHTSIVPVNSAIATPASRTNSLFYPPDAPLVLPSGSGLSFYASSPNVASNQIVATATIVYFNAGG